MGNNITRRELLGMRSSAHRVSIIKDSVRTYSGLNPYSGPWTELEILHLLRRATFGASKADVDLLKTKTISEAIDLLVDNPQMPTIVLRQSGQADSLLALHTPPLLIVGCAKPGHFRPS